MIRTLLNVYVLALTFVISGLASCTSQEEIDIPTPQSNRFVNVAVTFDGMNSTQIPDVPNISNPRKASDKTVADAQVARIALNIYDKAGTLVNTYTQSKSDTLFGTIRCKLLVGDYTFVAVAHNVFTDSDSAATIASATEAITSIPLHPTCYSCSQEVTIADNSDQTVTLDMGKRATTSLKVTVMDETPDTITAMQIVISPTGQSVAAATFDPATGYARDTYRYEKTWQKAAVGGTFTDKGFTLAALLTDAEQTLNFRVNMLNAKGDICFYRQKYATFKPATTTKCSGTIFSGDLTNSFVFDTEDNNSLSVSLD